MDDWYSTPARDGESPDHLAQKHGNVFTEGIPHERVPSLILTEGVDFKAEASSGKKKKSGLNYESNTRSSTESPVVGRLWVIPKTTKNGPYCLPAWHSVFKVLSSTWGVDQPLLSGDGWVKLEDQLNILRDVTISGTVTFKEPVRQSL